MDYQMTRLELLNDNDYICKIQNHESIQNHEK